MLTPLPPLLPLRLRSTRRRTSRLLTVPILTIPLLAAPLLACSPKSGPADSGGAADTSNSGGTCARAPVIDIQGAVAGTREAETSYAVPWTGDDRDFTVHAWYPTDDESGEAARWLGLIEDTGSWVDAALAPADCKAPLVVFSHGSQAWAGNGAPLMRQFVAAGWIAAAPDHTDNTLTDNTDDRPASYPLLRVLDTRATIDWFENLPEDDPLYDRVDTSRVFVFGHSYGGQTAWLLSGPDFDPEAIAASCAGAGGCSDAEVAAFEARSVDPRVVAVGPMAGAAGTNLVAEVGWAAMDRPVLYLTGSADSDGSVAFDATSEGDVTWVEIEGGCHESFTATELPCDVDKDLSLTITATYLTAFGSKAVWGWTGGDAVLDGSEPVDPIATLRR
jgi:predicted dienelactone hydrolase